MSSIRYAVALSIALSAAGFAQGRRGQPPAPSGKKYDLLIRQGHVIDPRNNVNGVRDVAIAQGKIALVAPQINPIDSAKTVGAIGLYVVPGLVDIHTHVFAG